MPFFSIQSRDGQGGDLMDVAQRYLQGISAAVQGRGLVAGLRAYLATVRKYAIGSAPNFGPFRTAAGYRWGVSQRRTGKISAFLYSSGYGNILEAGSRMHYAAIQDSVSAGGALSPGLGQWIRKHHPEMFATMGKTARFMKTQGRSAAPWVIPSHDAAEGAATEAFAQAVVDVIAKEVTE